MQYIKWAIRSWLTLKFIRLARWATPYGFTDDHLAMAEKSEIADSTFVT